MFLSSPKQTSKMAAIKNQLLKHPISLSYLIKGESLLTIGYTIFGNKSYSYIHSQISVHRKHEIIEQSGI
jgi:hypothetical protein